MDRCPQCGISASHPEATHEIIGCDEILAYSLDTGFYTEKRVIILCGICGGCWMASVFPRTRVPEPKIVSHYAAHPARLWGDA